MAQQRMTKTERRTIVKVRREVTLGNFRESGKHLTAVKRHNHQELSKRR